MAEMKYVFGDSRRLRAQYWYIAAPFFNPSQLALVQQLEAVFESQGVSCFSPRLQHGNRQIKIETDEQAREIFESNAEAIKRSTGLLAVVDWLLPEQDQVMIMRGTTFHESKEIGLGHKRKIKDIGMPVAGPLMIPDSGTVWELGLAYGANVDSVLFTTRPPGERMNIMLSQSAIGVAYGLDQFAQYLESGCRPDKLSQWEGKHQ